MDTATSVKVNICILFAKHCNSVNFRIMSRIQAGNRAGATIGRIVLPRYLGQILRARGVAGFRWDWEGGRLSPPTFALYPPLIPPVHHCIVPRGVLGNEFCIERYCCCCIPSCIPSRTALEDEIVSLHNAFLSADEQAFYSARSCIVFQGELLPQ